MAKVTIVIEDSDEHQGLARVSWSSDKEGGGIDPVQGTAAEMMAGEALAFLMMARVDPSEEGEQLELDLGDPN